MDLLALATDPFGKRYKKQSWSTTLGITAAKKRVKKAVLGPFRALNPFRAYANMKKRVKNRLGYNSELARAYRHGSWGTYAKRKILGESAMIMPFQESQFQPYNGTFNANREHESQQTSPLGKGVFAKLSKYAAPGAIMGLALLASRKHNMFTKSFAQKILTKAKAIKQKVGGTLKSVATHTGMAAKHHAKELWATGKAKVAEYRSNLVNKHAWHGKNRGASARVGESATVITMPFSESHYNQTGNHKSSMAEKVIGMGAIAGAAYGLHRFGRLISNPAELAKRAETANQWANHYKGLGAKASGITSPVHTMKQNWHELRADVYGNLSAASSVFRPHTVKDAENAARAVQAHGMTHDISTGRLKSYLTPKKAKKFEKSILKHGANEIHVNKLAGLASEQQRWEMSGGKGKKFRKYWAKNSGSTDEKTMRDLRKSFKEKRRIDKAGKKGHITNIITGKAAVKHQQNWKNKPFTQPKIKPHTFANMRPGKSRSNV